MICFESNFWSFSELLKNFLNLYLSAEKRIFVYLVVPGYKFVSYHIFIFVTRTFCWLFLFLDSFIGIQFENEKKN